MSIINYASREIQFKIVSTAPRFAAENDPISPIRRPHPARPITAVSLATAADRTLFFDLLA